LFGFYFYLIGLYRLVVWFGQ